MESEEYFKRIYPAAVNMETNEVMEYQQTDLSDRKYEQNGASNTFDYSMTYSVPMTDHFNPPLPTLKMSGNGSAMSAHPASPMSLEYSNNSNSMTPVNLYKHPPIPQIYSPEPPKVYPQESPKTYNSEPPESCNPQLQQPQIVCKFQHPQAYDQKPLQTCIKLKRTESEFSINEEKLQKKSKDSGTMPMVKENIENQFLNLQHSIFQDENSITQESGASDDSHIDNDNTDNFCAEEEIEKNTKYCRPGVRQGRQCRKKFTDYTDDRESETEGDNVIVPLVDATTPIEQVIKFFQQQKLLNSEMKCDNCDAFMVWTEGNWAVVGFFWECKNKNCSTYRGGSGHRSKKIITTGTFFHRSKISLPKWFDIMYLWSKRVGSKETCNQLNLHKKTIIGIYRFFREVCESYFKANPIKLGGPGKTIEIDICTINVSSKHTPDKNIWFLCIVDTNSSPLIGYMEIVETRDVGTLFPIILKVLEPGSIIHSKEWRAYRKIQALSDMDRSVNHSVNFVDVNMNANKQSIVSYWSRNKTYLTAMKGYRNSYLQEIMWHERFSDNVLESLCQQIALQYNDASSIDKKDGSCLEDETEKQKSYLDVKLGKNTNFLERLPDKNCYPRIQQGSHSLFQNNLTQESSVPDDSYIENTDGSCSKEEMEKHMDYLDVQLGENKNYVEETSKKCRPEVRHGRKCRKKVKDYADEQESEPESDNGRQYHNKIKDSTNDKDHEPEGNNVIVPLVAADTPIMNVIKIFQQHKLLNSEMKCDHCDGFMNWKAGNWAAAGFFWECKNKNCPTYKGGTGHRSKKIITTGTFFHKSKISLLKWYDIMCLWGKRVGVKATSDQMNVSRKAIIACYSFFREVCQVYFEANPVKLGGPGITIEIDVACLSHEPKRNKYGPWVLCIIETNCSLSIGYMEMVVTRDVATLLPIILKVVQPGSIIHSKEWRAYRKIQGLSYVDGIVNHSVSFVDVNTSLHKQTTESYLSKHKSYYAAMKGGKASNLNSYLQEFMWHERFYDNALESLCQQIAEQYFHSSYIDSTDGSCLVEEAEKQKQNLKVKLGENTNYLEEPPHKKSRPSVQLGRHSIFEDSLTQETSVADASYIENTDGSCSREKEQQSEPDGDNGRQCCNKDEDYTDEQEFELEGDNGRQYHNKVENYTEDQESEPEDDNDIVPLVAADTPIMNVINFFQHHKVLKSEMKCDHCDGVMVWKEGNWTAVGFFWECKNKNCPTYKRGAGGGHRSKKNITLGTFFHKSKISLLKWYDIMYLWSKRVGVKATSDQVNVSRKAIIACYSFFREVCQVYFEANPIKIGGPGITIEIDVFCLSHEPKRIEFGPWVLCIVDTNSSLSIGYMEMVDSRDVITLLPIILKVVQPGSIIHSKEWRAYRKIQGLSDVDRTVNHHLNFLNFVDTNSSVHKQTIESYWSKHKRYYTAMKGGKIRNQNSYLQEFMWRERFSDNALESLCQQIALQYSDD